MAQRIARDPVIVGSEDRGARGMRKSGRPPAAEPVTFYAVSRVRLDGRQRISEVTWGQIDPANNRWATDERRAGVADVVDAIHNGDPVFALFRGDDGHAPQGRFIVVEHVDGQESIAFEGGGAIPELDSMDRIVD